VTQKCDTSARRIHAPRREGWPLAPRIARCRTCGTAVLTPTALGRGETPHRWAHSLLARLHEKLPPAVLRTVSLSVAALELQWESRWELQIRIDNNKQRTQQQQQQFHTRTRQYSQTSRLDRQ
jgi:hypothetical protein